MRSPRCLSVYSPLNFVIFYEVRFLVNTVVILLKMYILNVYVNVGTEHTLPAHFACFPVIPEAAWP
jgi:hypothetical protein